MLPRETTDWMRQCVVRITNLLEENNPLEAGMLAGLLSLIARDRTQSAISLACILLAASGSVEDETTGILYRAKMLLRGGTL